MGRKRIHELICKTGGGRKVAERPRVCHDSGASTRTDVRGDAESLRHDQPWRDSRADGLDLEAVASHARDMLLDDLAALFSRLAVVIDV